MTTFDSFNINIITVVALLQEKVQLKYYLSLKNVKLVSLEIRGSKENEVGRDFSLIASSSLREIEIKVKANSDSSSGEEESLKNFEAQLE